MIKALSQKDIDRIASEGRKLLRTQRGEVQVLNVANALTLGQPIPLMWGDTEYKVKPISYRDGLELQRAELAMQRWAKQPPKSEEELEDMEADLIGTLALFHSLLDPRPDANPFADGSRGDLVIGCEARLEEYRHPVTDQVCWRLRPISNTGYLGRLG